MPEIKASGTSIDLSDRFARSETSTSESSPGDCLILDLDSGNYYGVGESGGFIWERLDGKTDLQTVAEAVARHFEIESSRAAEDLLEFVARLHELGLVVRIAPRHERLT